MSHNSTRTLVEAAIFAALAMALSFVPDFLEWFSPSWGMIPLVLFSLRRGPKYGLLAGLIWGLLHFVAGKVYYLSLSQVAIEYILAFTVVGFAGLVTVPFQTALKANQKGQALGLIWAGTFLACLCRYIFHFIAGVIFWGSYAPEGMSPYFYSFTVNGTAAGLTLVVTAIVLSSLYLTQKNFYNI
ncbi:energy-coupled thiamine transporter ThiT [Streptococcus caprae]|uniref:Energy-coupled thiamine transporter ThiT n=1 Tax=Streptococcus caprae TaxID=1640501 RepID=A0ABV8CVR1_9STRE